MGKDLQAEVASMDKISDRAAMSKFGISIGSLQSSRQDDVLFSEPAHYTTMEEDILFVSEPHHTNADIKRT